MFLLPPLFFLCSFKTLANIADQKHACGEAGSQRGVLNACDQVEPLPGDRQCAEGVRPGMPDEGMITAHSGLTPTATSSGAVTAIGASNLVMPCRRLKKTQSNPRICIKWLGPGLFRDLMNGQLVFFHEISRLTPS
jgi:hypothetical protein